MPYKLIWEDAPSDGNLPVVDPLPDGVEEERYRFGAREAHGYTADGKYEHYHHCYRCGGWIPGRASMFHENTHAPHQLAGRKGQAYHCRRCGWEVAFVGLMS